MNDDWLRITCLIGPITEVDGQLQLLIPLVHGGSELGERSRGIGEVQGNFLKIVIPQWLADKLGIQSGMKVEVDNRDGKFNIRRT
jgi:hypothetical protein